MQIPYEIMFGLRVKLLTFGELFTYPLRSKQVVVQGSEPLSGIVAAISSAHEVFNDQSNVDEANTIVGG